MKKITLSIFICILPIISLAQQQRVIFGSFKSWNDVVNEANRLGKNIFLDAYATWCVPCKQMDSQVYSNNKIAAYLNANFISVKVQFDRTSSDSEFIKGWYNDIAFLSNRFKIDAFPTYLFFSSDGNLIDRGVGFQPASVFINTLTNANDPKKNLAGQLENFERGNIANEDLLPLALMAKQAKHDSLALNIAQRYKINVIDRQDPLSVINPHFFEFISHFYELFSVDDPISQYLYSNPEKSDSLMCSVYSRAFIDYLVYKRYILPEVTINGMYKSMPPNWRSIEKKIQQRFDKNLAKKITLTTKASFYKSNSNWDKAIDYSIKLTQFNGLDTSIMGKVAINNISFDLIFMHGTKSHQLRKATKYMKWLLSTESDNYFWLDTYANILYKRGLKKRAIDIQRKALLLAKKNNDVEHIEGMEITLKKMLADKPTWIPVK